MPLAGHSNELCECVGNSWEVVSDLSGSMAPVSVRNTTLGDLDNVTGQLAPTRTA